MSTVLVLSAVFSAAALGGKVAQAHVAHKRWRQTEGTSQRAPVSRLHAPASVSYKSVCMWMSHQNAKKLLRLYVIPTKIWPGLLNVCYYLSDLL